MNNRSDTYTLKEKLIIANCWEGNERLAAKNIESRTPCKVLIPEEVKLESIKHRKSPSLKEVRKPLYPGYLFIALMGWDWQLLLEKKFVFKILYKMGQMRVPHLIERDLLQDFFVDVQEAKAIALKVGSRTQICSGPFEGMNGVVVCSDENRSVVEIGLMKWQITFPTAICKSG